MNENRQELFLELKSKGLYNKSFKDFNTQFSDLERIEKLYQALIKKGLYTRSFKDFQLKYFPEQQTKISSSDIVYVDTIVCIPQNSISNIDSTRHDFIKYTFLALIIVISIYIVLRLKKRALKINGSLLNKGLLTASKMVNNWKTITLVVFITLLTTNPSRSEFASYLHITGTDYIGRDKNYFVCSVYSIRHEGKSVRFFGILGNFYRID